MTPLRPNDWKRVRSVFQQALALPAEQRPQFVADVCGDDTLRRHIIALLEAHPRAERFLEAPAVTLLDARIEHGDLAGTRFGPYQLEQLIGASGMGWCVTAVYRGDHG